MTLKSLYHILDVVQDFLASSEYFGRYDKKIYGKKAKYRKVFRILWKRSVIDMK